jgi:ribosomal protein S18 acetylase RimI-like enzyme
VHHGPPALRLQGIASDLLRLAERRARELGCRAMYLHVLAQYNAPAISFYHRHGFWEASLLKGFYNIRCHCFHRLREDTVRLCHCIC